MSFLIKFILLLTIFVIPLLTPINNLGYEEVKVLFFIVLTSLSGFFWLFNKSQFQWSAVSKTAVLFTIILIITSFSGLNPVNSLIGTYSYFQGVILYLYLFLFFIMVKSLNIELKYWAWVLSSSAIIVGILAIKDWMLLNVLNLQIPNYAGRVVSTFGQPNFYSGFILLTIPFTLYLLGSKGVPFRGWTLVSFPISVLAIILSQSKTAILLLLGLMIFWLLKDIARKRLLISTVIVIVLASSWFLVSEVIEPIYSNNPDLTKISIENRIYIWPVAIKIILEQPITGYGLENIQLTFSDYFISKKHVLFEENLNISPILISFKELNINRTHNYILDLLLFSGILGLGVWISLLILLFIKLKQMTHDRGTNVLLVSLITYLIWIQFQNQSVVHLMYFWLIAGLIDSSSEDIDK